jgi:hypothetical protein
MGCKCSVNISQKNKCPTENRPIQAFKKRNNIFQFIFSLNNSEMTYSCYKRQSNETTGLLAYYENIINLEIFFIYLKKNAKTPPPDLYINACDRFKKVAIAAHVT